MVTSKNVPVTNHLLDEFGISYTIIEAKTKTNLLAPARLLARDFLIWRFCKKLKPELLTGVNSVFCAHVGKLLNRPCIIWDHTDHYKLLHKLTRPFATVIYSPDCYYAKPSKKQIFYPGYHELSYLHPSRFQPDINVVKSLGINPDQKYCIIRLSAWQAVHDIGQRGFDNSKIIDFVKTIAKYAKPYISAEASIIPELREYCLNIPPHLIHHVIAFASLYVGEGASMASESATLGVPTVYLNSLKLGYINMQEKYGLTKQAKDSAEALKMSVAWLEDPKAKEQCDRARNKLLADKTDMSNFVVDTIEKYCAGNCN